MWIVLFNFPLWVSKKLVMLFDTEKLVYVKSKGTGPSRDGIPWGRGPLGEGPGVKHYQITTARPFAYTNLFSMKPLAPVTTTTTSNVWYSSTPC